MAESSQDSSLGAAQEFLRELERPNPYVVLDTTRDASRTDILKAFTAALVKGSAGEIANAREQLADPVKRLAWDARFLDCAEWLRELEELRNQYALFDYLKGLL